MICKGGGVADARRANTNGLKGNHISHGKPSALACEHKALPGSEFFQRVGQGNGRRARFA